MTQSDAALPIESVEPIAAPALPPAPPARRNALAVLVGLVVRPRATFAYLREHGGASWVWPLLLALALTLTARLIAVPIERAEAQAALEAIQAQFEEQSGGNGNDIVTFGRPVGGPGFSVGPGGPVGAASPILDYGLPVLGVLGQWLLAGLLLLCLAWLLGGRPRAGAMLRMSAWALLVPVLTRAIVMIAVMLGTGRVPVAGLSRLPTSEAPVISTIDSEQLPEVSDSSGGGQVVMMGPGGTMGGAGIGSMYLTFLRGSFMSALDLYTLWALALLLIGVAVTAKLGWIKSTLATAGYFGLSLALAALPPVLSFWMMTLSGAGGVMPMR